MDKRKHHGAFEQGPNSYADIETMARKPVAAGDTKVPAYEEMPLFDNPLGILTVEELARILGRSPKTIRNWVAKRSIPFVMLGRKVMFRKKAIETWLEKKEHKPWR